MKYQKVIAKTNLPSRFPFGLAVLLLWIGDKIQSPVYYWIIGVLIFGTAAVVLFRQMTEQEVELKDLHDDSQEYNSKY